MVNPDKWINLGDTPTLLVWRIPSREISSPTSSPDHDDEEDSHELMNCQIGISFCTLFIMDSNTYIIW